MPLKHDRVKVKQIKLKWSDMLQMMLSVLFLNDFMTKRFHRSNNGASHIRIAVIRKNLFLTMEWFS